MSEVSEVGLWMPGMELESDLMKSGASRVAWGLGTCAFPIHGVSGEMPTELQACSWEWGTTLSSYLCSDSCLSAARATSHTPRQGTPFVFPHPPNFPVLPCCNRTSLSSQRFPNSEGALDCFRQL